MTFRNRCAVKSRAAVHVQDVHTANSKGQHNAAAMMEIVPAEEDGDEEGGEGEGDEQWGGYWGVG